MQISTPQARLLNVAIDAVLEVQAPNDPGSPPWVDLEVLDGTDVHLLNVRFPGRCELTPDQRESRREELALDTVDQLPREDCYATGVFVVILDAEGYVAFARHTAVGALRLDSNGMAVSTLQP